LRALAEELSDARRAATSDGDARPESIISPTREAKLRWLNGLLGAGLHYGGERTAVIADEIAAAARDMFATSVLAKSLPLAEMGAHLTSLLCGAMTGTYVNDLFAAEAEGGDEARGAFPSAWVVSKVREGEDDASMPRPFLWRKPSERELEIARALCAEFLETPCRALLDAHGGDGDGDGDGDPARAMSKEETRAALAAIGGVASGFRTRMRDFAPTPSPDEASAGRDGGFTVVGVQDVHAPFVGVETRDLAGRAVAAVLNRVSADDVDTLGMALSVAEDVLSPFHRDYHGVKAALRTWHSDATALTAPQTRPDGDKTRPRWLVGEHMFLRFLWRSSQAAYHAGGPGSSPPTAAGYVRLMDAARRTALHKYRGVRSHARQIVEGCVKRFPPCTATMCSLARDALLERPADEDRAVAACALLKVRSIHWSPYDPVRVVNADP
jgi:proteasome activator subunit 4